MTRVGRVTLWLWNIHNLLQKASLSLQRERYFTVIYQEDIVIETYEQLRKIERTKGKSE